MPRVGHAWHARLLFIVGLLMVTAAHAADSTTEVKALKKKIRNLEHTVAQLQHFIQSMQKETTARNEHLQQQIETLQKQPTQALQTPPESPLDRALQESGIKDRQPVSTDPVSRRIGGTNLRLLDLSLNGLFAGGTSTKREEALQTLQGGGHDPRKRGFTVQNIEFSLMGAVDPYFTGEAHLIYFIDPLTILRTFFRREGVTRKATNCLNVSVQLYDRRFVAYDNCQ